MFCKDVFKHSVTWCEYLHLTGKESEAHCGEGVCSESYSLSKAELELNPKLSGSSSVLFSIVLGKKQILAEGVGGRRSFRRANTRSPYKKGFFLSL